MHIGMKKVAVFLWQYAPNLLFEGDTNSIVVAFILSVGLFELGSHKGITWVIQNCCLSYSEPFYHHNAMFLFEL